MSFAQLRVTSGVAAIWTFWIYPGAAESEGAAKVGLKQHIVENILHFQKYSEYKIFAVSLILVFWIRTVFLRKSVEHIHLKHTTTPL